MTAKEYLSQARYLDARVNAKIAQLASLNDLATKATSTISDMPRVSNYTGSSLENTVVKIIDLQEEINYEIDTLVDLKKEIYRKIQEVSNPEYQTVLERRYICLETWEQIAVDMNYSIQHIHRMHSLALKEIIVPTET